MHVSIGGARSLDCAGTAVYAAAHDPFALRAATLRLLASNACLRNLRITFGCFEITMHP